MRTLEYDTDLEGAWLCFAESDKLAGGDSYERSFARSFETFGFALLFRHLKIRACPEFWESCR